MNATFKNFMVSASFTGSKPSAWDGNNWNHSRVTVTNKENGKRTSFDFWGSIVNPELETEYDLLNAFYCFVGDAISGKDSFEDFCCEFGLDTDSMTSYKTWNACKKSASKLSRIYSGDIYDLANDLSEKYA